MSASPAAPSAPVTSVAQAIARMELIEASTPASDGLACFNRMYLGVTREVNSQLSQQFFADPEFMTLLDVTFANLYFGAADAAAPIACSLLPAAKQASCNTKVGVGITLGTLAVGASAALN